MSIIKLATELDIKAQSTRNAALIFRAANHPLRQRMLSLLHSQRQMTVTDLYNSLNLIQAVASQQLAILRKQGLVCTRRAGKNIFYSVNYKRLEQLHNTAAKLIMSAEHFR